MSEMNNSWGTWKKLPTLYCSIKRLLKLARQVFDLVKLE